MQVLDKKKVYTRASIGTRYDIGVQAVSMVSGNIILGKNISSQEFIRILSMTNVVLERDGELYKEIDPEFDGMFFFENVLPGKYKMKFNYLGSDSIEFTEESLDIDIKLIQEDEGEYFEGYEVVVNRYADEESESKLSEKQEDEEKSEYNLGDVLNNF